MGKNLKGRELGSGISQRKDGKYHGRYVDRFGKRRSIYDETLTGLRKKLNKAIYENEMKLNIVDSTIFLDDWYEKWMEVYKEGVIRDNSKRVYHNTYTKYISPVLGKFQLQEITTLQITALLKKLKKDKYSYEVRNKTRIILLDMFDKAMIDQFVNRNPVRGIRLKRDEKKEIRVLDTMEQCDFFDCCRGTFYDNAFVTHVSTGLRSGELFALEPEDLDFKNREIHITKTLLYENFEGDDKKTYHFGPPKTKNSNRIIPMSKRAEIALKKQLMQKQIIMNKESKSVPEEFKNLIFTTRFGTPLNATVYNTAIAKIINEVNLCKDSLEQIERFSGHCFRHTFATRCYESGIDFKVIQQYLGHATLQMTMDLYVQVSQDKRNKEIVQLDNELDQIFENGDELALKRYENQCKSKGVLPNLDGVQMG